MAKNEDIPVDVDTPAENEILEDKKIPEDAATRVDKAILAPAIPADHRIPAAGATPADNRILAAEAMPAAAKTLSNEATPVAESTADGAGAIVTVIVGVVGSALDTMPHLTRMAPFIRTSRTIAIPTAITINGAIGNPQPLVAIQTRTGIKVAWRQSS
jgi:hypothetical protein